MNREDKKALYISRLERMCSMREYCEFELRHKLEKFDKSSELSAQEKRFILESLKRNKFFDDSRYAEAFIKDKHKLAGWGRRKIEYALHLKHIEKEIVESALDWIDSDKEEDRLSDLLRRKIGSFKKDEDQQKVKVKLIRFALGRGFNFSHINGVINKIIQEWYL